jgi:hypothetical protein
MLLGVAGVALVVSVLLAAAPVFGAALGEAALQRRMAEAGAVESGVQLTGRFDGGELADADRRVRQVVGETGGLGAPWTLAVSDAFTTQPATIGDRRVVVSLGTWNGPEEVLGLVEGRTPAGEGEAAIHVAGAEALGVELGDSLAMERSEVVVETTVVGLFDPPEAVSLEPVAALTEGVLLDPSFVQVGPVLVSADALAGAGSRLSVTWLASVVPETLTRETAAPLVVAVGGLERRLPDVTIDTMLPSVVSESLSAIEAAGATITAILVALGALSMMALVVTVAAVVDQRRLEIELVRSRGGSTASVGWSSATEGVVIVSIATLLAPPAALAAIEGGARSGLLGRLGDTLEPVMSSAAFGLSAAAGVVAMTILVAPAVSMAGGFAAARAARTRVSAGGVVRRWGLDLVVAAAAVVAVWRLRSGWDPETGVDPLVTLAPAMVWLAGVAVLLRVVPFVVSAAAGMTRRGAVETELAVANAARRPDRTSRQVMLVASAAAILVFAVVFSASWRTSQVDQAVLEVGAPVAVEPGDSTWSALAAMDATGAVERRRIRLDPTNPSVTVLGVDTGAVTVRPDLVSDPESWAGLGSGARPGPVIDGDTLTGSMRVTLAGSDPPPGPVRLAVVTSDRYGVVAISEPIEVGTGAFTIELGPSRPYRLVGFSLSVPGPEGAPGADATSSDVDLALEGVAAGGATLSAAGSQWRVEYTRTIDQEVSASMAPGDGSMRLRMRVRSTGLPATATARWILEPGDLPALRAFFTPAAIESTGVRPGDRLVVPIGAASPEIEVVGTIDALPTAPDATSGIVVDYADLALWQWVVASDLSAPEVVLTAGDPVLLADGARSVVTVAERYNARFSDPVSVGVIGALVLGGLAVAAVVGFGLAFGSIASARARSFEFALMEALGLTRRQLARMGVVEHLVGGVIGAVGGLVLGILLGAVAVPSLTVDSGGRTVVPVPRLVLPWGSMVAVTVGALVVTVGVARLAVREGSRAAPGSVIRMGEER